MRGETNVSNGVCGVEFDRKDIEMNKLVVTRGTLTLTPTLSLARNLTLTRRAPSTRTLSLAPTAHAKPNPNPDPEPNPNPNPNQARNVHGVPLETIGQMRARYEHDWRRGDPQALAPTPNS